MRLSKRAKRRLAAVLVIGVLAGGGLASWRVVRRAQAHRLTTQARIDGLAAFQDGDYETALSKLGYCLRRQGDDVEVLLAFADSRAKVPTQGTKHLVESARFYTAALRLEPDNQEAMQRLLDLHRRLGMQPEWMTIADRILALDPNHVEALAAKGEGLRLEGAMDEALSTLGRLVEIEPDNMKWRTSVLGIRLARNDPDEQLIEQCDAWIDTDAGDGRLSIVKARLLASLGRIEPAKAAARLAASRGVDDRDLLHSLIELLEQLKLHDDVEAAIARAQNRHPDAQWVVECAVARLWHLQRYDEALQVVLDAEGRLGALELALLRRKALVQLAMGSADTATTLALFVQRVQEQDPEQRVADQAWAHALLASLDRDRTSRSATLRAYEIAIALQPQDPVLHHLEGQLHSEYLEYELAAGSFVKAITCDLNWVVPRLALGRSLLAMGRAREALDVARRILRQVPSAGLDPYVLVATAWLAVGPGLNDVGLSDPATGRPIDLIGLLESLHEQSGRDPQVGATLIQAYLLRNRPLDATELLEHALADPALDATDLLRLARISEAAGLGMQRRLIDRARTLVGLTLDVAEAEARLLEREGRTDEGLALLDQAMAPPTPADGVPVRAMMRAGYLARTGHPDALGALEELLEAHADSSAVINLVLGQRITWDNEPLLSQAIDGLEAILGKDSPRVLLARANQLLLFRPQDAAARAEAMVILTDVLKRTPGSVAALTLMSKLLGNGDVDDREQAVKYLRQALELRPDRIDLYPQLITLLQQQGDRDSADDYLRLFGARADVPVALRRVEIGLLTAQGDFDTAVTRAGEIVDESSPELEQLALASLHLRAGDYGQAERIYTRLLATPDRSAAVTAAAAEFYANVGRPDEAIALLAPGANMSAGTRAMLLGRFHRKHGDLDEAARWLEAAVEASPDDPDAWRELVGYWLQVGNVGEARRVAVAGVQALPDDIALRTALAMTRAQLGNGLTGGIGDLLNDLGSADDDALQATISLYTRAADDDGTLSPTKSDLTRVRELLRDHPLFRPAWHMAALLYSAAGDPDEAIRIARRAVNQFPGDANAPQWAVRLLVDQARSDEALDMAYTWRRRTLQDPLPADIVIASLRLDLQDPAAAVQQLAAHANRIQAERNRYPDHLAIWLRALLLVGRFDTAAAVAGPLIGQDERWRNTWLDLAANTEPKTAAEALLLVETLVPDQPSTTLDLAKRWLKLARRTGETAHYQRAEALARSAGEDPRLALPALHIRAAIATARGDVATAEPLYRAILVREPDDVLALNNLAYALIRLGERCEEALELSTRALALDPDNPSVLDTHARALACSGNPEEAETAVRLALSSRPDDPGIRLTLVRALMGQTRFTEAESELEGARTLLRRANRVGGDTWKDAEVLQESLGQQRPAMAR